MPSKTAQISEILIGRIKNGDYSVQPLPSGRKLAAEMGVSYLTARSALDRVIEQGLLERGDTGRLELAERTCLPSSQAAYAYVIPTFGSPVYAYWRGHLAESVELRGEILRTFSYDHGHESVVLDVLDGDFKGVFLLPPVDMQPVMRQKLIDHKGRCKLVTLFEDLTQHGIPLLDGCPPEGVLTLIDQLVAQGHRKIDCLNTQPVSAVIQDRITCWREGLDSAACTGRLFSSPVEPFSNPMRKAREVVSRLIAQGSLGSTALFCTTLLAAQGAIRGLADHGLTAGEDISVVTFGEHDAAELLTPTVTTVDSLGIDTVIGQALRWIDGEEGEDRGHIRFLASEHRVYEGESSCSVHGERKTATVANAAP